MHRQQPEASPPQAWREEHTETWKRDLAAKDRAIVKRRVGRQLMVSKDRIKGSKDRGMVKRPLLSVRAGILACCEHRNDTKPHWKPLGGI